MLARADKAGTTMSDVDGERAGGEAAEVNV